MTGLATRLHASWPVASGAAVFLSARLWLILSAALVMGMPRLGDDAFTYFWKGTLFTRGYDASAPALRDVLETRALQDAPSPDLDWVRSRVTMRAVGAVASLGDGLYGATARLPFGTKWNFAAVEILIAVVLAVGIARFLTVFFGAEAAGIGLLVLAFTVFPNQGLSYFITSTLALGIALILWAETASPLPKWWLVIPLCIALPFVHAIGKVYLLLLLVWPLVLSLIQRRRPDSRQYFQLAAITIAALLTAQVVPEVLSFLAPPPSGNLGGIAFSQAIPQSVMLAKFVRTLVLANPLLIALPALGLFFLHSSMLQGRVAALVVVVFLALLASVVHQFPRYPAELGSRILVLAAIVAAGIGGCTAVRLWQSGGIGKLFTLILLAAWVLYSGTRWVGVHALEMQRPQVVDEASLSKTLAQLPSDTAIVYFEADIALFAGLLNGADQRHAVVLPMLKGSPELAAQLARHPAAVGVVPMHPALNVLERKILTSMTHRFGFPGSAVETLELTRAGGFIGSGLWLHVGNGGGERAVRLTLLYAERETGQTVAIASGFEGWIRIAESTAGLRRVTVIMPDGPLWVTGISLGEPKAAIRWPWATGIDVSYRYRRLGSGRLRTISLTVDSLLAAYGASDFGGLVDPKEPVLSDNSGLVFLGLRRKPAPLHMPGSVGPASAGASSK